jgi:general secretion pathway protein G
VLLGSLLSVGLAVAAACSGTKLSAEERQVKSDLEVLRDAVSHYMASNLGHTPASLDALLSRGGEGAGFLSADQLPKDPWDRPYVYLPPADGQPYNILCLGRDGMEGGSGDDADIDLNMIREQKI